MSLELTANVPKRLREALHLVHCLQKERGASCSHYAYISHRKSRHGVLNKSETSEKKTEGQNGDNLDESQNRDENFRIIAMSKAVQATDGAYKLFWETSEGKHANWNDVLLRIRAGMQKEGAGAMAKNSIVDSHRILVWFSLFITSIIDESVEQIIKKEQKIIKQIVKKASKVPFPPTLPSKIISLDDESLRKVGSRRTASFSILMEPIQPSSQHRKTCSDVDDKTTTKTKISSYTFSRFSPENSFSSLNRMKSSLSESSLSILIGDERSSRDTHKFMDTPSNNFHYIREHNGDDSFIFFANVDGLLTLLHSFVRLKESTGIERAIFSVLMTIGIDDADQECFKLFSDLVIQIENQRRIIRQIKQLARDSLLDECRKSFFNNFRSLLTMVEKFVEPNREMLQVQAMIDSFNLKGLQHLMPWAKFWNIISLYMDQLHSLELLIVEELQGAWIQAQTLREKFNPKNCVASGHTINQGSDQLIKTIRDCLTDRVDANTSPEELRKQLSSVSAEEIKKAVLACIEDKRLSSEPKSEASIKPKQEENSLLLPTPSESLKEWDIDLYEIEFCQRIGRGVAGTTYLANWSGQKVAVKVAAFNSLGLEGWQAEVSSLQQLHHPNIIRLLGAIYNPSPQTYGIVLEFCDGGDLQLAMKKQTPPNFFWRIADDVANGMAYLHRKNILHRDIKPANVLLTGDINSGIFNAKLTDFGLAIKHRESPDVELTAETGTYRWMAPEVIRHENYSFMADIYSFGIVLWQLVTHDDPFQDVSQVEAASKVAINNERPPFPMNTPKYVRELIEKCWDKDPKERLNFSVITHALKEIRASITIDDLAWMSCPHGHHIY